MIMQTSILYKNLFYQELTKDFTELTKKAWKWLVSIYLLLH